ncbi:MAG: hypothetical protein MK105_05155 [Crocinitomicaceae bacterium]|nr:hypothetical protein [Crocinitomicaceae bacterium]
MMIKGLRYIASTLLVLALIYACSTEKNTLLSRSYHGLNAHYNGYFNANELIDESLNTYRSSVEEDYYSILPIDAVPNLEEVTGMYPAIDTAISKCTKVIQDHSMPSNDRPARKKDEHNKWIDENWTTIGQAFYYRRDYEGAMKNFKFIKKFFKNDPSLYIGELWMAKTNIAQGKLTDAKFNLDNLDKAIENEETRKKEKSKKSKSKKKKKEDKIAKFPKKIRFDLEKTKADLALKNNNKEDAIEFLESSLNFAKKSKDKARVHFILGQLYEEAGKSQEASNHYGKVLKGDAPFQMSFNARLKKAFLGDSDKKKKDLHKMLKDAKNAEYKDQIYYALAGIEFQEGNEPKGIEYLHSSAFYSTKNTRQKGMAYEMLGDMSFSKRSYVSAQKYYDSCATVIKDTYPNAEAIRNKASNLADLVVAVETAQYEDSVQMIAALGEKDRKDFLKALIKKTKEDAARQKAKEAERLRELQANENLFVQSGGGSKWYFNNAKTRAEGLDDFKRLWGTRENEDDWRRSEKIIIGDFTEVEVGEDSVAVVEVPDDTLTVDYLTSKLPLSDSALALSNINLLKSHYNAGVIYKEQLNEDDLAIIEFEAVLDRKIENKHNLMSAFQLYKLQETRDASKASKHKSYIMDNYPNSDYANYLRDPNYFIKKKERDALAEQEYVKVLDRYNRGIYYPVITKANIVIEQEKDNVFRSKYMLLKALATGQINEDKSELLPVLNAVIAEYPETLEATKAAEMIDIIKNGYSKNEPYDFENKSAFNYDDKSKQMAIIFLDPKNASGLAKTRVVDFQREYFSRDKLKVSSKIYGNDQSVILVSDFDTEADGMEYIRVYKKTRKHLLDLQKAKIMLITPENLKVLFQKKNLAEYEIFYDEYY